MIQLQMDSFIYWAAQRAISNTSLIEVYLTISQKIEEGGWETPPQGKREDISGSQGHHT